jgi:hypothetical protein
MNRKKFSKVQETNLLKTPEMVVNNRVLKRGDSIKIHGEYGGRFKFHSHVINKETGAEWIDCFEVHKGVVSAWRSFKSDKIKLIPIKRGKNNVNRSKSD